MTTSRSWVLAACLAAVGCGGSGGSSGPGADVDASADGASTRHLDAGSEVGSILGHHDGGTGGGDAGRCGPGSPDQVGCKCTIGTGIACYPGPAATRHVGACKDGTQTCQQDNEFGSYGPCTGAVLPGPETCTSTVDANCNGLVGCADPTACPGGCPVDAGPDTGACAPPISSDTGIRCPNGTVLDATGNCCPCTAADCATNNACCVADVCKNTAACATCSTSTLPAVCKGQVDLDCDDFPEDCDQLCCPCKPASCQSCPGDQVPCDDGTGTLVCTDVTSNDSMCGACDTSCSGTTHCVNGWCQ